jgi:hypothetical protein
MTWMKITRRERSSTEGGPPPRPRTTRFPRRRQVTTIAGVALLVFGAVATTLNHDQRPVGIAYGAASAWLPSEQIGELTLVDGPSATVVTGVEVAEPGNLLTAAQHGLTAFVFNGSTSKLSRVDGATWEVSSKRLAVSKPETAALTV